MRKLSWMPFYIKSYHVIQKLLLFENFVKGMRVPEIGTMLSKNYQLVIRQLSHSLHVPYNPQFVYFIVKCGLYYKQFMYKKQKIFIFLSLKSWVYTRERLLIKSTRTAVVRQSLDNCLIVVRQLSGSFYAIVGQLFCSVVMKQSSGNCQVVIGSHKQSLISHQKVVRQLSDNCQAVAKVSSCSHLEVIRQSLA